LLKRFIRPEVKGQGRGETKCTFMAEAFVILTLWRRGSFLLRCIYAERS